MLSWSHVAGATGYEVYYEFNGNPLIRLTNTSNTNYTFASGLKTGTMYTFHVISYVNNGSAFLPSMSSVTRIVFSKLLLFEYDHFIPCIV